MWNGRGGQAQEREGLGKLQTKSGGGPIGADQGWKGLQVRDGRVAGEGGKP